MPTACRDGRGALGGQVANTTETGKTETGMRRSFSWAAALLWIGIAALLLTIGLLVAAWRREGR